MTIQSVQKVNPVIEGIGEIANKTDTLNKFVKTVEQGVVIARTVAGIVPGGKGVSAGLGLLGGQLKTTKSVINATNFLGRIYEWGDKKARSKIMDCGDPSAKPVPWQKTASRIALTVAQVLETGLFIDKCSNSFFYQASLTVRGLPILEIVKNVFYMGSAFFSLWTAGKEMSEALSKIHLTEVKKHKWDELTIDSDALKDKYQKKLNDKGGSSESLMQEIEKLSKDIQGKRALLATKNGTEAKVLRTEIKQESSKLEAAKANSVAALKFEAYLNAIDNNNAGSIKVHKIEKYNVRLANNWKIHEKSWLSIVVDVGKMFMITLGMLVVALSVKYPALTGPAATLVISSLSLVSNGFGLTKNLYSELAPKTQSEPVFAASV
jgi:hypothetical protein